MKTINLFFDMEFTSLSPDAQPISLGIVSEDMPNISDSIEKINFSALFGEESKNAHLKSFYAEFSDFDIQRCDDWVKENVVGKLKYYGNGSESRCSNEYDGVNWDGFADTNEIKRGLKEFLSQFSDYSIQFVLDSQSDWGMLSWYWMLQLLAEWEVQRTNESFIRESDGKDCDYYRRVGLPRLPANISPVPQDLNDLIAIKKGISVKEAFDVSREELLCPMLIIDETSLSELDKDVILREMRKTGVVMFRGELNEIKATIGDNPKHNALWDAKVIKAIYEKLK